MSTARRDELKNSRLQQRHTDGELIQIGAGPVGLFHAILMLAAKKDLKLVFFERHAIYQREQRLKFNFNLMTDPELRKRILALIESNIAEYDREAKSFVHIPIQDLEKCLQTYAKELGVVIHHKKFISKKQYAKELATHGVTTQAELENAMREQLVVGFEGIHALYPNTKIIIGSDGSKSTVRDIITQDVTTPLQKTDLRNLIELKYQVEGEVKKLDQLKYYHTQTILNGFLCQEHVKYHPDTQLSEVTLRFIVDNETFNDKRLDNINAKNLLALTDDIPHKLSHAITMWVNTRGDKLIAVNSATLNKITLSIYSSTVYSVKQDNVLVALLGDASCGFPFMNGLSLGFENSIYLANLLLTHWDNLQKGNPDTIEAVTNRYNQITHQTFEKGSEIVAKADQRIQNNQLLVNSFALWTFPIKGAIKYFRNSHHTIFASHAMLDLWDLKAYVQKRSADPTDLHYQLSNNLLAGLQRAPRDIHFAKMSLGLAYKKNILIENYLQSTWWIQRYLAIESAASRNRRSMTLNAEEVLAQTDYTPIPKEFDYDYDSSLSSAKAASLSYGSSLHNIIYQLYQHVLHYGIYEQSVRERLNKTFPVKATGIIEEYIGVQLR